MSHFSGGWKRGGKASPRKRHERGKMNRLESDYSELLHRHQLAGEIAAFDFEPLKLRIGDACYYAFDFLVQAPDFTMEAHEVKGHWEDDARVKFRAAAEMHPWLRFFAITREKGGMWIVEPAWIEDRERGARYGAVRGVSGTSMESVGRAAGDVRRRKPNVLKNLRPL